MFNRDVTTEKADKILNDLKSIKETLVLKDSEAFDTSQFHVYLKTDYSSDPVPYFIPIDKSLSSFSYNPELKKNLYYLCGLLEIKRDLNWFNH